MFPNFLVIGPGRSGTTWMYHALKNHPQICVSSAKETQFFETEFERGIDWYAKFFAHCDEKTKATGEVSNTYFFCEEAPQRIRSINPRMKLISCLRNPVERTFSHYLFFVRGGQFKGTFREIIDRYPYLIEKGKCYKYLKPYFDTFRREQLCIKLFSELKEDQISFIQSIYKFLYVDDRFKPEINHRNRLSAAKPRNQLLSLTAKKAARFIRSLGYPEIISQIKYSGINKVLYKEYGQEEKPTIAAEDRAFLTEKLRNDVKKLGDEINLDLEKIWFS